jgi:hypothetical protein
VSSASIQELNAIAASPDLATVLEPDGALAEAISPATFAAGSRRSSGNGRRSRAEHKIVAE